jgi:hypothetical protein
MEVANHLTANTVLVILAYTLSYISEDMTELLDQHSESCTAKVNLEVVVHTECIKTQEKLEKTPKLRSYPVIHCRDHSRIQLLSWAQIRICLHGSCS